MFLITAGVGRRLAQNCIRGVDSEMKNAELSYKAQCIWKNSEQVAQLLRNATRVDLRNGRGNLLIDKITERQNMMLVTVRTLCLEYPEGVSLKQLANQLGITTASASVMVDALTGDGLLVRKTSPTDRRAIQITLSSKASAFYDNADKVILKHVLRIGEALGTNVLIEWHDVLKNVKEFLIRGLPE